MPKLGVSAQKVVAIAIFTCAILALVAIGIGTAYMLGWPAGLFAVGILVWIELNLLGRAHEHTAGGVSQSGKSPDTP